MKYLSLFELQKIVEQTISQHTQPRYWVVAELSDLKTNSSGHCYMELVEKSDNSHLPRAKARAMIWANRYSIISKYFEEATGSKLSNGMKVLVSVQISYHPLYGFSLVIDNIDPTYTLGDVQRQRQEIIAQLVKDGVYDMNRELDSSGLYTNIAVISSSKAAGYQDFMKELEDSGANFKINTDLFEAVMQGDSAEVSIIDALERVDEVMCEGNEYDAVVIIRGGGATSDLACFDSYEISSAIAQFPLPVLTGIGHDKDISVADMVAYKSLKTPTAVAQYIAGEIRDFVARLDNSMNTLQNSANLLLLEHSTALNNLAKGIENATTATISNMQKRLEQYKLRLLAQSQKALGAQSLKLSRAAMTLQSSSNNLLTNSLTKLSTTEIHLTTLAQSLVEREANRLTILETQITQHDPQQIMAKGYSMICASGKTIRSVQDIKPDQQISLHLKDGVVEGKINNIKVYGKKN